MGGGRNASKPHLCTLTEDGRKGNLTSVHHSHHTTSSRSTQFHSAHHALSVPPRSTHLPKEGEEGGKEGGCRREGNTPPIHSDQLRTAPLNRSRPVRLLSERRERKEGMKEGCGRRGEEGGGKEGTRVHNTQLTHITPNTQHTGHTLTHNTQYTPHDTHLTHRGTHTYLNDDQGSGGSNNSNATDTTNNHNDTT